MALPGNGPIAEHPAAAEPDQPPAPRTRGALFRWAFAIDREDAGPAAAIKAAVRVLYIMAREFSSTRISLHASALTFSIILSMVPLLALSTAVLKGLGSDNQLRVAADRFIEQFATEASAPQGTAADPGRTPEAPAARQSLSDHLHEAVDTIFNYVERTNFAALGAFGVVGLVVVVVMVLSTIEGAMNTIWHSARGRSIFRKVMDYLALMLLLPISINAALAGDAVLESDRLMLYLHTVIPAPWLIKMLFKMLPYLFIVLSLMFLYLFFPHANVKVHAALAGAFFAATFWLLAQKVYIHLQLGVAKYNAIYGSFATVPLFLVWLQLGWTFILLGASLAYALQNRNTYLGPGGSFSPARRLQLGFDILDTVYDRFGRRRETCLADLMEELPAGRPGELAAVLKQLHEGGLLRQTANQEKEDGFLPVTPREQLDGAEVVALFLGPVAGNSPGGRLAHSALAAAENAVRDRTGPPGH